MGNADDITHRAYAHCADSKTIYQIRSGSSCGMNTRYLEQPVMDMGDIVIADTNIGKSGALEQSVGHFQKIIPDAQSARELSMFLK